MKIELRKGETPQALKFRDLWSQRWESNSQPAHYESLRDFAGIQLIMKIAIAAALLSIAIIVCRPFCRILCPLGAVYSLFNKIAFIKMHCNKEACTPCGSCAEACQMKLNPGGKELNSPECVRCGDCISACKQKALHY